LNPSLVMAHGQLGCALHLKADHQGALDALGVAIRLSPNDHDLFFFEGERASASLMLGDFEAALLHAELSVMRRPGYWRAHVCKVNALSRLGRTAEARHAHDELMSAKVAFDPEYVDWIPFVDSSLNQFLKDGLNLAINGND
jgi:tetratricopeptide (TPR) repeat protein